jgi:hypothetical protein
MSFPIFEVINAVSYIVTGAAALATVFPKAEKVGVVLSSVSKVLNFLAFNFGNAKNQK